MANPLSSKLTHLNEFLISPCSYRVEYRLAFKDKPAAQVFVDALKVLVNLSELPSVTILNNQRLNFSIPVNEAKTTKKIVELMKGYFPSFKQPKKDLAMKRVNGAEWEPIELLTSSCAQNGVLDVSCNFDDIIRANIDGSPQYYFYGYHHYDYLKDGRDRSDPTKVKFHPDPPTSHLEKRVGGYYEMVPSVKVPEPGVEYPKL